MPTPDKTPEPASVNPGPPHPPPATSLPSQSGPAAPFFFGTGPPKSGMELKDWIQLLVGAIIIGSISWIGTKVYDIGTTLAAVKTSGDATAQRVGNIASALPEFGKFVAREEITRKPEDIVFTFEPVEPTPGKFVACLAHFDASVGHMTTYHIVLANKDDAFRLYAIDGALGACKVRHSSFSQMIAYSNAAGMQASIPSKIIRDRSYFVCSKGEDSVTNILEKFGTKDKEITVNYDVSDWVDFTKSVSPKCTEMMQAIYPPKAAP